MDLDTRNLQEFEQGLDPRHIENSVISAEILGYGEISTVFQIQGWSHLAIKRMPMFSTEGEAQDYVEKYHSYCEALRKAGLNLPEDRTEIISAKDGIVVLYIIQRRLDAHRFCHSLIHSENQDSLLTMLQRIIDTIEGVWAFNAGNAPGLEIAIDGQLSNWVLLEDGELYYVDTGTPLMRHNGVEQLDPELFLTSAPSFLRWLIRWLFLSDVLNRYYVREEVYTDLLANLYKEQRPDLVPGLLDRVNLALKDGGRSLSIRDVQSYYSQDKLIWRVFLSFRRLDRWLKATLLRGSYPYILPGKIKR